MTHQPIHAASDQQPNPGQPVIALRGQLDQLARLETTVADTTAALARLQAEHADTVAHLRAVQAANGDLRTALTTAERERDSARADADDQLGILDSVWAALNRAGWSSAVHGPAIGIAQIAAERDQARAERDEARKLAEFRAGVIRRHANEAVAAGAVVTAAREAVRAGTIAPLTAALRTFDGEPADPELAATHRQIAADEAQLREDLAAGRVQDEMGAADPWSDWADDPDVTAIQEAVEPPAAASVPVAPAPEPAGYIVTVRRLDDTALDDGPVVMSVLASAPTASAALEQALWAAGPERPGEVETHAAEDHDAASIRQRLDRAIDEALPFAGGQVRGLLKALRRQLARVDAKRAAGGTTERAAPAPVEGSPTYSVVVTRLGPGAEDGPVVVSAVADAATPAAALEQTLRMVGPERPGEVETLRAERDALRDALGRALERTRVTEAEMGVLTALTRFRSLELAGDTSPARGAALLAVIEAMDRLPQEPAAPATIAAAGPDGGGEGDGMPDTAEGDTAGRRVVADHPHTDPGDGRTECDQCGKFVWPVIHSCKGVPVTGRARARAEQSREG